MKAWQFTGTHEPLVLNEVDEPVPSAEEVLIDIKAAGLCHSDVGLLHDDSFPLPDSARLPLTLGHEIAGVISQVGADVTGRSVEDRVALAGVGDAVAGIHRDGGYTFKVTARPDVLVRIPPRVSFEQAAAGTDAGATAYRAVIVAGNVTKGDRVAIIGFGGLGQIGARIAVLTGCEVDVAEVRQDIWPLAHQVGVARVVKDVTELADERLDVIIDFAGFGTTTAAAIETVRPGGRVVQVGMGRLAATISTKTLILNQITLIGCRGDDKDDVTGVYDLMATGELDPIISTIGFEEIPAGLDRPARGAVVGRLVARIAD